MEQIGNFLNAFRRAIDEHSLISSPTLHHHSHSFHYQQSQQQRHSPLGETSCKKHIIKAKKGMNLDLRNEFSI